MKHKLKDKNIYRHKNVRYKDVWFMIKNTFSQFHFLKHFIVSKKKVNMIIK